MVWKSTDIFYMHIQGPFLLLKSTAIFLICNAKHPMTASSESQKIQMINDIKLDYANLHPMHAIGRIHPHEHIILVIVPVCDVSLYVVYKLHVTSSWQKELFHFLQMFLRKYSTLYYQQVYRVTQKRGPIHNLKIM